MTAEPAAGAFVAIDELFIEKRVISVRGDGGRIYAVHAMREGVFDSRIVSRGITDD